MKAGDLLTAEEQKAVVDAVRQAELDTSGEIRVHIEDRCGVDPMERAAFVFRRIGMEETADRNGVLIYIAGKSKVFAIIGDEGINKVVPQSYWSDVCASMAESFRAGRFADGIAAAVRTVGEKLKAFFPYRTDDVNELPDDISFGEDNRELES